MLEAVRQERNTWRLLTSLYRDRLETEMKSEEEPMMVDSLVRLFILLKINLSESDLSKLSFV